MKLNLYIIFAILVVIVFNACVLREPESKPDITKTGKQMFLNAEAEIQTLIMLSDYAIKLETYWNTPDSLKETVRQKYFSNNGINHVGTNKWYICTKYDTICSIITDLKSIHSVNAKWLIQYRNTAHSIVLKCIEINKWQVSTFETPIYNWISTDTIEIKSTNKSTPKSFGESYFYVSAKGVLNSRNDQNIQLQYNTVENLTQDSAKQVFKSGILDLTATEVQTSKTKKAIAEYLSSSSDNKSVKISIDGYTKTYTGYEIENYYYFTGN
jgi:hypothetical protein